MSHRTLEMSVNYFEVFSSVLRGIQENLHRNNAMLNN